ncbi:MAG TPA: erythromycin biosynthesis sensory transduction protein eryC1 [Planctomycetaceae bacterium]|nr:erythromycin biosynthesis sensory transduction protein eryC1 [Planctomycetaceae bacterium]
METPIPLVDLKTQSAAIKQEVLERIGDVIDSAGYILGEQVSQFEQQFAQFCNAKHCVGLANGTDALHLALRALEIGPGDEVITVGNSFAATALAIHYSGATPILVDCDEEDFNIDVNQLESAITERTRAIIPVHLYGHPAPMPQIMELASRHNLRVIEDAAQAHGAEIDGKRIGSWGDVACFSFYPGKNLGAFGDGGAAVTNDPVLADKIELLRSYGQVRKNVHDRLGFNCRLDTVQAAVLLTKMQYIEQWTEARRQVASWYREALAGAEGVTLPPEKPNCRHVYHLFVIRHPQRDELLKFLAERQIYCGIHYPHPLSEAQPFEDCATVPLGLPVATRLASEIISLPMYPEMTRQDVSRVAEATKLAAQKDSILP